MNTIRTHRLRQRTAKAKHSAESHPAPVAPHRAHGPPGTRLRVTVPDNLGGASSGCEVGERGAQRGSSRRSPSRGKNTPSRPRAPSTGEEGWPVQPAPGPGLPPPPAWTATGGSPSPRLDSCCPTESPLPGAPTPSLRSQLPVQGPRRDDAQGRNNSASQSSEWNPASTGIPFQVHTAVATLHMRRRGWRADPQHGSAAASVSTQMRRCQDEQQDTRGNKGGLLQKTQSPEEMNSIKIGGEEKISYCSDSVSDLQKILIMNNSKQTTCES